MADTFKRLSPRFNYSTALYHNGQYLLVIDRAFNVESYRRIYFKDIQSLQVQKTVSWLWGLWLSGLTAALFITIAILSLTTNTSSDSDSIIAAVFFFVFGSIAFASFIGVAFKGPSCKVYACTAVQRILLTNINTMKKFNKFTKSILPIISQIQGTLSDEQIKEKLAETWESLRQGQPQPGATVASDISQQVAADHDEISADVSDSAATGTETTPDSVEAPSLETQVAPASNDADSEVDNVSGI